MSAVIGSLARSGESGERATQRAARYSRLARMVPSLLLLARGIPFSGLLLQFLLKVGELGGRFADHPLFSLRHGFSPQVLWRRWQNGRSSAGVDHR